MGDVVDLHKRSIPLEDDELVEDLARYGDGTLSEAAVKAKHHLNDDVWAKLGEDDELVARIEARKLQRIRGGQTKRERAQNEIIDAPPILAGIMRNPNANERHKIDSIKALDALATNGGEAAGAGTRFEIFIDLSAGGEEHILRFNKSREINADDSDPNDIDAGPQDVIAALATTKPNGGNDGGHI